MEGSTSIVLGREEHTEALTRQWQNHKGNLSSNAAVAILGEGEVERERRSSTDTDDCLKRSGILYTVQAKMCPEHHFEHSGLCAEGLYRAP